MIHYGAFNIEPLIKEATEDTFKGVIKFTKDFDINFNIPYNRKVFFGTAKGVSVYDKGKFTNYPSINNNPIFDWYKTKGNLWFHASTKDRINCFEGINLSYLIFPKIKNANIEDNTFGITGISKDEEGNVWITTCETLFNHDGKLVNMFDLEKLNLIDNERLHIRSGLADSKGRIWKGNNGIGVLHIESNSTINFS